MKQWIAGHFLSAEDFRIEDSLPISDKEFYISLGMIIFALTAFGTVIHLLGS